MSKTDQTPARWGWQFSRRRCWSTAAEDQSVTAHRAPTLGGARGKSGDRSELLAGRAPASLHSKPLALSRYWGTWSNYGRIDQAGGYAVIWELEFRFCKRIMESSSTVFLYGFLHVLSREIYFPGIFFCEVFSLGWNTFHFLGMWSAKATPPFWHHNMQREASL